MSQFSLLASPDRQVQCTCTQCVDSNFMGIRFALTFARAGLQAYAAHRSLAIEIDSVDFAKVRLAWNHGALVADERVEHLVYPYAVAFFWLTHPSSEHAVEAAGVGVAHVLQRHRPGVSLQALAHRMMRKRRPYALHDRILARLMVLG